MCVVMCCGVLQCVAVHMHAFVCLTCVYVCLCRAGSHLLPDGTNMCLATGKDGVAKIHEVSADIGFVGLQVAC